jgi:hypothetical protein
MHETNKAEFRRQRDIRLLRSQATVSFAVAIAAIGAVMMTLTSSPTAKGASFLWIPAALQLMAGVWLGPWRGLIAGGLGAYLAGILAYGGWGIVDIIMNPIAGGFANSLLPALLFTAFNIDPTFGTSHHVDSANIFRALGRVGLLLAAVIIIAFLTKFVKVGVWGYIPTFLLVLIAPIFFRDIRLKGKDFSLAVMVCVFISAVSALIGAFGQVVGGQTWQAALIGTALGWFFGDTVSAILGLFMLAYFTERAREAGICVS